jgi:hypothetical protein
MFVNTCIVFTIRVGLLTLSLCNADLLVRGFYKKLTWGGGCSQCPVLCVNEPKKMGACSSLARIRVYAQKPTYSYTYSYSYSYTYSYYRNRT